jgi:hypothetical protein
MPATKSVAAIVATAFGAALVMAAPASAQDPAPPGGDCQAAAVKASTSAPGETRFACKEPSTKAKYIDGPYRARTEDTIGYGIVENGQVVFHSSVKLNTYAGLQTHNHWIDVTWVQKDDRQIVIDIPVKMQEDVDWLPDRVTDSALYGGTHYQTTRSEHHYLKTDKEGVYYWFLDNMKIRDRWRGDFKIGDYVEAPHFRCYKTVPCKYPNGQEA